MRIIAIEGIDGTGKTTQAELLAEKLGCPVLHPFDSIPEGKEARAALKRTTDPMELGLLMCAVHSMFATWLRSQRDIDVAVMDRSIFSALAYQADFFAAKEDDLIVNAFQRTWCVPDLVFLLDLPVEEAKARLGNRELTGNRADDFDSIVMQRCFQKAFLAFSKIEMENTHFVVVDATRDAATVHDTIMSVAASLPPCFTVTQFK